MPSWFPRSSRVSLILPLHVALPHQGVIRIELQDVLSNGPTASVFPSTLGSSSPLPTPAAAASQPRTSVGSSTTPPARSSCSDPTPPPPPPG